MPASVRGWTFGGSATNTLVIPAANWTTSPQDGDLLVFFGYHGSASVATDYTTVPSGFTIKGVRQANTELAHWCYLKVAAGESGDYTWIHGTANDQGGYIIAVQDVDTSTVDLLQQVAQTSTSVTIVFTGDTLVDDSLLVIGPGFDGSAADTYTIDVGTEHAERDHTGGFLHSGIYSDPVGPAGTYNRTVTKTSSAFRQVGTMLAVRPGGAPPPPPTVAFTQPIHAPTNW